MTIVEAVKSGKRFRREIWAKGEYADFINLADDFTFTKQEIMATDWVIEVPSITITEVQFKDAWDKATLNIKGSLYATLISILWEEK